MDYVKYAYVALIGWGFWAIGSKIMTRHFNPASTAFWISLSAIIFLSIYIIFSKNLTINKYAFYCIPIGFISLFAMLAFYKALKIGPASVVLPLTNLFVVLPVLYGFIFLKESITLPRILGIVFAIIAAILLSL